jgi:hypothetical protein
MGRLPFEWRVVFMYRFPVSWLIESPLNQWSIQKGGSDSHASAQAEMELTEAARLNDEFHETSEQIRWVSVFPPNQ